MHGETERRDTTMFSDRRSSPDLPNLYSAEDDPASEATTLDDATDASEPC